MGDEDIAREAVARGGNEDAEMDMWSHKARQDTERQSPRGGESDIIIQESQGKEVDVI